MSPGGAGLALARVSLGWYMELTTSRDLVLQNALPAEQTQAACRHHLATWSKASLLPLVAMAMPAQGSPSGPEMLGLISLSAAESGSGRLSQPLGLCNMRGQGGGRASDLGTHDVWLGYHQTPIFFLWSYASNQELRDRKEQTFPSTRNNGKKSWVVVDEFWSKWG